MTSSKTAAVAEIQTRNRLGGAAIMEQISKLLFAATLIVMFAFILILVSSGFAGNGGEYWGYDGRLVRLEAAQHAVEVGDYRYLEVDLTDSNGKRVHVVPVYARCRDHPLGPTFVTRTSSHEPIHGCDSVKLATSFAEGFNNAINNHLVTELSICCGDC